MEYAFTQIEQKWQDHWNKAQVYKVNNDSSRPKYYVLDMFPYPSGDGLSVGHLHNIVLVARHVPDVEFWLPTRDSVRKVFSRFESRGRVMPFCGRCSKAMRALSTSSARRPSRMAPPVGR